MKNAQKTNIKWQKAAAYYAMGVLIGLMGIVAITRIVWHSKFYPNVILGSLSVGGMKRAEAREELEKFIANNKIVLIYNGFRWELPLSALPINMEESLNRAYRVGRRLDLRDYALVFVSQPQLYPLVVNEGTTEIYNKLYEEMASAIEIPVVETEILINKGVIKISNGSDGIGIDSAKLESQLKKQIEVLNTNEIIIPTKISSAQLREEEKEIILQRAVKLQSKTLTLTLDDEQIKMAGPDLISFLSTKPEINMIVDPEKLSEYVEGLATSMNRDPVDAKFGYSDGKVTEFAPSKDGIKISIGDTSKKIQESIKSLIESEDKYTTIEIVVERTAPAVTIDKVNELGIEERIGRGESYYAHSIPNRIYNVGLASERINGALIAPGEEVSFNKLVGEVSAATGYRSAYIISQGRTVLGDGGGLCQVSTTLFRAAMNAGLPILERWGHSYRVSYYELNSKPGVDATVIAPSKDFRFKNDTPGHILIQTINDPKNLHLVIEIYGTSDGRVASLTEPKVWGVTPPLPTIYEDDPTLPVGTMKQVDWAAGGARASFEYKVTRNGETLQDQTFSTVYRPWAAVYLRGTGASLAQ
ncbi:MAG: VanW family protein [Candidatus Microgenomates bacterium]